MSSTSDDVVGRIDAALATVSGDPISEDAMCWQPAQPSYEFAAVLVPAELGEAMSLVDLGQDAWRGARKLIGCHLITKMTVDGAGAISTDFLFDEDASPDNATVNHRATELTHVLKMAQLTGDYPAPGGATKRDLAEDAQAWRLHVRLYGPVVIVGADERTGETVPVPSRLLEFLSEEGIDLTEAQPTSDA